MSLCVTEVPELVSASIDESNEDVRIQSHRLQTFYQNKSLKHSDSSPTVQWNEVPETFSQCGDSCKVKLVEVHGRRPFVLCVHVVIVIVPYMTLQHVLLCVGTLISEVPCDTQVVNESCIRNQGVRKTIFHSFGERQT